MSNRLTVLICTHERAGLLTKVLDSLNGARRPNELAVDLLVVANACSDGTHQLLKGYVERAAASALLPLRWIDEPTPGKAHALNRGTTELVGDWVAIVDDDHRVAQDFLIEIGRAMKAHGQAQMLCGRILPDWQGSEPPWVHDTGPYRIYPLPIPRQDFGAECRELDVAGPIPGGGNQIIRVNLLRKLGGFATDLGPQGHDLGGGEDTEYMLRAMRMGARLWYEPRIVQHHFVDGERLRMTYLLRKAFRRSASSIELAHAGQAGGAVPLYLYRKLLGYVAAALTSLHASRRRFYLVRCAAALGEMSGHRRRARRRGAATSDR